MTIALSGLAVGVIASLALSRAIGGLLCGITATDLTTYALISTLLIVVAMLARTATRAARRAWIR